MSKTNLLKEKAEYTAPVINNKEKADLMNIENYIKTVTTIPTYTPRNFFESWKIYYDDLTSPTTKRLYIYSFEAKAWNYLSLT